MNNKISLKEKSFKESFDRKDPNILITIPKIHKVVFFYKRHKLNENLISFSRIDDSIILSCDSCENLEVIESTNVVMFGDIIKRTLFGIKLPKLRRIGNRLFTYKKQL